jgi:hypothetical protein
MYKLHIWVYWIGIKNKCLLINNNYFFILRCLNFFTCGLLIDTCVRTLHCWVGTLNLWYFVSMSIDKCTILTLCTFTDRFTTWTLFCVDFFWFVAYQWKFNKFVCESWWFVNDIFRTISCATDVIFEFIQCTFRTVCRLTYTNNVH